MERDFLRLLVARRSLFLAGRWSEQIPHGRDVVHVSESGEIPVSPKIIIVNSYPTLMTMPDGGVQGA